MERRLIPRIFCGGLILAVYGATPAQTSSKPDRNEQKIEKEYAKLAPSVVTVLSITKGGKLVRAVGFVISNREIVTSYSAVSSAISVSMKTADQIQLKGLTLESSSDDMDLAVLKAPRSLLSPPVMISPTLPKVGDQALIISEPIGVKRSLIESTVAAIREQTSEGVVQPDLVVGRVEKPHRFLIDLSGSSALSEGSPVFGLNGRLVGVSRLQTNRAKEHSVVTSSIGLIWLLNNPGIHLSSKSSTPTPEQITNATDADAQNRACTLGYCNWLNGIGVQLVRIQAQGWKDLDQTSDPVSEAKDLYDMAIGLRDRDALNELFGTIGLLPDWNPSDARELTREQQAIVDGVNDWIGAQAVAMADHRSGVEPQVMASLKDAAEQSERVREIFGVAYRQAKSNAWFDKDTFLKAINPAVYLWISTPEVDLPGRNWWPDALVPDRCRVYFAGSSSIFQTGDEVKAIGLNGVWQRVSTWRDLTDFVNGHGAVGVQFKVSRDGQETLVSLKSGNPRP